MRASCTRCAVARAAAALLNFFEVLKVKAEAKRSANMRQWQDNHLALMMMPSEQLKPKGRDRTHAQNNNKAQSK
jgi:hypothetical protein